MLVLLFLLKATCGGKTNETETKSPERTESDNIRRFLPICSIKPGSTESAQMPKYECDFLINIFKDRDGEIKFVSMPTMDRPTAEHGFCIDVKCLNARLAELAEQRRNQTTEFGPKEKPQKKKPKKKSQPKVDLLVDEQEHKFEGPKREPTMKTPVPTPTVLKTPAKTAEKPAPTPIVLKTPAKPIVLKTPAKTPEIPKHVTKPTTYMDTLNKIFNVNKRLDDTPDTFTTRYSSQCSIDDRVNQNTCCSPWDNSPCCDYNQRIRRVFGIAQFGIGRHPRPSPHKRIVGGSPAGALKTSMVYISKHSFEHQFCGGVIIHRGWIMTAAHCLRDYCGKTDPSELNQLVIKIGKTSKENFIYDDDELTYRAIAVHCHEQNCKAEGSPRINDIALVRVNRPMKMSHAIDIAQLPKAFDEPVLSKDCIMLGWGDTKGTGYSNVLKEVRIPLISNEQCNDERWRSCGVRSCMLCAGKENASPCSGDSGGPLFCPWHSGLFQLHGIYSYGRCGADRTKPAVFTRVSNYIDWIENTIETYNDSL
jgi:endopeptidase E